jgi:hypothetical protein
MKTITATELKSILAEHKLWLDSKGGSRAILSYAILSYANLEGMDLKDACLEGANPYGANLKGARLYGANLVDANLEGANLEGAFLYLANLVGTIFEKKETTVFSESNLRTKFDEFAKSLGLKIVSLKVEREKTIVETIDL